MHCLVAVSAILAATYTAGLLTLLGSVFLASHVPGTSLHQKRLETGKPLPIEYKNLEIKDIISTPIIKHAKTDQSGKNYQTWIDTNNFSKPSSGLQNENYESKESSFQFVSWDWWNVPVMNWLAKTSEMIEKIELPIMKNYVYFLENKIISDTYFSLEDHIHKATKTRIQDQMERSWHSEWTDTITYQTYYYNILPYLQNIKS